MRAAIQTAGLTKTYGTTKAVTGLDLEVEAGQVFGFLGPNGAGKSTTIRMLLALQRPTAGGASLLGLDAGTERVEIHRRIGYLPGELALYPRMTARQHVEWFAKARGQADTHLAEKLARRFDLALDRPAKELSKGNRQKIGLILAFMHQPELLILDEPTSGLDPIMQREFETLVGEVVAEGRTIFLSSHSLDEVQRVARTVGIIREGRLVTVDTVDHLRESAPRTVEVRLHEPVAADVFARLEGVTVVTHDPTRVVLQVSGAIGPLLRVIGDLDPVDVVARHADLDELFLAMYRDHPSGGDGDAA